MPSAITEARVLTPTGIVEPATLLIGDDGRIESIGDAGRLSAGTLTTSARGLTVVPGFIDLHVHGGGGFSLATHDAAEIESYAHWVVSTGVTSILATICAADLEEGLQFVRSAAHAGGAIGGGANLLGVSLEGPFVNPDRRGALPSTWLTAPDPRSFDGLMQAADGGLRMITLAPELPGAAQVLRTAVNRGVVVSVGHTDAGYDAARKAFASGASHVTHAFNAMRPFHHREPGPVGAAIESESVTVEVVADGVHLHPATVGMLLRALGPQRIALVTDGVTPAGLAEGSFRLGGQEARLTGGRVLLPDGTIAGGAATMDQLVRNVVDWGFADLSAALCMASTAPARVLGLSAGKGQIAPGSDADLVALDGDLAVTHTWVGGKLLYSR